jgi:hypothetical protein
MMEAVRSSDMSVLTRATRRNISQYGVLLFNDVDMTGYLTLMRMMRIAYAGSDRSTQRKENIRKT